VGYGERRVKPCRAYPACDKLVAGIERFAGSNSSYTTHARGLVTNPAHLSAPSTVIELLGILSALRDDYEAGYLTSIEELIHADLFADFLDMAEELLKKKYKDAAAVITGSVLEEHLGSLLQRSASRYWSRVGRRRPTHSTLTS
jgi:hypothetical protein